MQKFTFLKGFDAGGASSYLLLKYFLFEISFVFHVLVQDDLVLKQLGMILPLRTFIYLLHQITPMQRHAFLA